MSYLKLLLTSFLILLVLVSYSQVPTIGLLKCNDNVSNGYTLFTPERNNDVYLINNCGEKINKWTFSEQPGLTCYILEDGTLLRAGRDSLEIRDWDNNLLWSYSMNENGLNQHHDIEPLPNGNILCLLNDTYTKEEMVTAGKDPSTFGDNLRLDKIVELKPIGTNSAEIIWKWKVKDHLIQELYDSKSNYGVVSDNPNRIDINYDNGQVLDWTHFNSLDYNRELDQIIVSARHLSEIYIIDHSTTMDESATNTGGNANLGGDILWRWGNPQVYKQGEAENQKLFSQHDARWVESGYLDNGKISVFNNGGDGTESYSSIHLINPEFNNNEYLLESNRFAPHDFDWSWRGTILENTVLEGKKSGAHSLPNGNFIICETSLGQVSEINKNGEVIWIYKNPTGSDIFNQYETPTGSNNAIFRAEKYPADYIGFNGLNITTKGIIEDQNETSDLCENSVDIETHLNNTISLVNPIESNIIKFTQNISADAIKVVDINGRLVFEHGAFNGNSIPVNLNAGMYLIQLHHNNSIENRKVIVNQ